MFTNIFTNLRAVFEVLLAANIYSPCENSCLCNCIGLVKQLQFIETGETSWHGLMDMFSGNGVHVPM